MISSMVLNLKQSTMSLYIFLGNRFIEYSSFSQLVVTHSDDRELVSKVQLLGLAFSGLPILVQAVPGFSLTLYPSPHLCVPDPPSLAPIGDD